MSGRSAAAVVLLLSLAAGCGGGVPSAGTSTGTSAPGTTSATTSTSSRPSADPYTRSRHLTLGRSAWVSVSVATLWRSPTSPRTVDRPALQRPAQITRWLSTLTLDERRGLDGRADTQALLGDRVVVLALPPDSPDWARVAVPSQPSPLDAAGYPGWVPRRQLTATRPAVAATRAIVVTRTALLQPDRDGVRGGTLVSFGTSLPVLAQQAEYVRVVSPTGQVRRLSRSAVVLRAAGRPAWRPGPARLVDTARTFLGLPYLWSGTSGFGLDCSGLAWLAHRALGITVPRDTGPQSQHGSAVGSLRPGDLMFFATDGVVHHVAIYAGGGLMLHSPHTGASVRFDDVTTPPYAQEYSGSRRYLP